MSKTAHKKSVQSQRKVSAKSVQGRINRAEGLQFEQLIEKACTMYRQQGLALIEKTPEPIRILGRVNEQGQFKACFCKQAQPDFKGTLLGGRAICFDAKCTCTDKIALTALTDEELRCLTLHRELGAWAGVLMCFIQGNTRTYAMIPINIFMSAKAINGHKHWTVDEVSRWKVKASMTGKGYIIDFLVKIITE